ncbi:TPA: abortive phage infection protein, partial [Escherichia coli]|nr:abortive phage infection protein [Escherichia coli]
MHPVLNRYIQDLASTLDIAEEQDKLFEYFCNFVVTSKNYLGRFNPVDITTQEDDASIDGLAVLIDSEIILTQEDAIAAFESHKSSLPVELLVIQAKSG